MTLAVLSEAVIPHTAYLDTVSSLLGSILRPADLHIRFPNRGIKVNL